MSKALYYYSTKLQCISFSILPIEVKHYIALLLSVLLFKVKHFIIISFSIPIFDVKYFIIMTFSLYIFVVKHFIILSFSNLKFVVKQFAIYNIFLIFCLKWSILFLYLSLSFYSNGSESFIISHYLFVFPSIFVKQRLLSPSLSFHFSK